MLLLSRLVLFWILETKFLGKDKTAIFPWEKTPPETAEFFNKVLDNFYKEMCEKILESRELALKDKGLTDAKITKEIFNGKTFTAKEALEAGYISYFLS